MTEVVSSDYVASSFEHIAYALSYYVASTSEHKETSTLFSGCISIVYVYRCWKSVATGGLPYLFSELSARVLSPVARSMGTRSRTAEATATPTSTASPKL